MNRVRVGVIGVGRMGERHCRVLSNLRSVQLTGVCDINEKIGKQVAKQYDIPFFNRIDDLLDHVDAVSLATPTSFHYEQAMQCLEKGVHLLIEKPITETPEQAENLVQKVNATDVIVLIGHIERFNPAYIELKNVLDGMTPLAINLRRLSPYEGSNKDVDVVLDLMIHDTNLMLDLMRQEPTSIHAYGLTAVSGMVDHAVAQLCFKKVPLLTMTASRLTELKIRSIEISAYEAYVECDLLNKSLSVYRSTIGEYLNYNQKGVKYRQESFVERIYVPAFEPLYLELQHFIECIVEQKTPAVSARDGLNALRLAVLIRDNILAHLITSNNDKFSRTNQCGTKHVLTTNLLK